MKTDIEISDLYKKKKIVTVAKKFGILPSQIECFGNYRAKLNYSKIEGEDGKLILVTATNPTKFGEGKTTVSIGLGDAMNILNKKTVLALREPSLGPVFGIKGGATGGGYSQVVPMEDINLHFNGDFHAITSANNLLCSLIDNSIHFGNPLNLDLDKINFHRCLDINDRALRNIELNIEGKVIRKEKFNITAASEMMGIMTLSTSIENLKERIGNICIGFSKDGKPVFARELKCEDAVAILLKDALKPNIVQTLRGNMALVHLGPFANVSHGCNSLIATQTALKIGDYVVTEAGFGSDLGAEKFLDLICEKGGFNPFAVVLVSTIRSVKLNGGVPADEVNKENVSALKDGLPMLLKHYNNLKNVYNTNVVVTINKFPQDTTAEIKELTRLLKEFGITPIVSEPYSKGGKGCLNLAKAIAEIEEEKKLMHPMKTTDDVLTKLEKITKVVYGADNLILTENAQAKLKLIQENGFNDFPVIIAKTQYSLTDDGQKIGVTKGFDFTISDFEIHSGAGYVVAIAGKMLLMPGLSRVPNACNMTINNENVITGIF